MVSTVYNQLTGARKTSHKPKDGYIWSEIQARFLICLVLLRVSVTFIK